MKVISKVTKVHLHGQDYESCLIFTHYKIRKFMFALK